jgi:FkbH-like protein
MADIPSPESVSMQRRADAALAKAFRERRSQLAQKLFEAIRTSEGILPESAATFADLDDWNQQVVNTAVDLAQRWFTRGDASSELLFQGWMYSELRLPGLEFEPEIRWDRAAVLNRARTLWFEELRSSIPATSLALLEQALGVILEKFQRPVRRSLHLLLVGDCLKWEILNALIGPCIDQQIEVSYTEIGERVAPVLRNRIRSLDSSAFDLVFFGPFTHQFFQQYGQLLRPQAALWSRTKIVAELDTLFAEVSSTLQVLVQQTRCPVYIHNTSGTIQLFGGISGMFKHLAAQRNRSFVRETVHSRVSRLITEPAMAGRVRLLDERALLKDHSSYYLSQVLFNGLIFHPARVGALLGQRQYFEAVFTTAFLATKKVVVCDLDNTLWDGVIGEGEVTHFAERQRILKQLRERGVLLSINSKNDPANVHFRGSALQLEDFVAPQINWTPKTTNMKVIVDELNMKAKDFIFIDDRPDELERMRNAFPELVALDATQTSTWDMLDHWASHLNSAMEEDRTKLYHERAARDKFLSTTPQTSGSPEDEAAAFADLELQVKIEAVNRSGLKRVVELINRTNQFNLCGSRTTLPDEENGLGEDHFILTAAARDKFGTMGVVGVMRVNRKPDGLEVPIFVLSCRVFGFGIEYALLNAAKNFARSPEEPITGLYKETQANTPGRQLYAQAGLKRDGNFWKGRVIDLKPAPDWLTVESSVR